ncbi:30S ribosomal protein S15 [bacterium]|nr:30S ribosomal protein S15 [bacterium]
MALTKEEKTKIIKKFAQAKGDTGSPEVQVALLTEEIKKLKTHLGEHIHDKAAKKGLLSKIAKRRRLLRYLASRSRERYEELIKMLGLRK